MKNKFLSAIFGFSSEPESKVPGLKYSDLTDAAKEKKATHLYLFNSIKRATKKNIKGASMVQYLN